MVERVIYTYTAFFASKITLLAIGSANRFPIFSISKYVDFYGSTDVLLRVIR